MKKGVIMQISDTDFFVFQTILENFPGHIYWKDLEGRYLGVNSLQSKHLGFQKASEMIGKTDLDLPGEPEEIKKFIENDRWVIDHRESLEKEESSIVDGHVITFLSQKMPLLDMQGHCIGVIGVSLDITDKKEREKLEIDNQALNKAKETMRFWAGAIAHEIRTPLFSLAMMGDAMGNFVAEMKRQEALFADQPAMQKWVQRMEKIPSNIAEVIKGMNHFVDMSLMKISPERPKMYELKPLDLNAMLNEVMKGYPFKPRGEKSERELVHLNTAYNFKFQGEETLFKHLLYNLMKNALYFIREAGKGEIFIETREEQDFNLLIFKDTGPGIPAENVEHLFKAFFSRSQNGTGVGLSLCKTIMQEFGGSIACESVFGEYTTFLMRFPKFLQ
jgi:PAS domain S-box-containing protein